MGEATALVRDLLEKGVISEVAHSSDLILSPIFLTKKSSGDGYRFILNLKRLNSHMATVSFKMESLQSALDMVVPNGWMAKVDLKDAYYAVAIAPESQSCLAFHWLGRVYQFLRMPNGYNQAPRKFTKLLKPVAADFRARAIRTCFYLDDVFLTGDTEVSTSADLAYARNRLTSLGFVLNDKKSSVAPSQSLEFLGFKINSRDMTLCIPEEKRLRLRETARRLYNSDLSPTVRDLASLLGSLQAADPAIRTARLHYRSLQRQKIVALRSTKNYMSPVALGSEARKELSWWLDFLSEERPVPIRSQPENPAAPIEIFTDSSQVMWGGFCSGEGVQGSWGPKLRNLHINELEILAAQRVLRHFAENLREQTVVLHVDNKTALAYLRKMGGTRNPRLNHVALETWSWLLERKLDLVLQYIPSKENRAADLMSRSLLLKKEWSLNSHVFESLTKLWGQPTIDLFASRQNAKTSQYFSWGHEIEALGQNALSSQTPWPSDALLYAYPPENLIAKTLRKLEDQKVHRLILVAPAWKTRPWYPLILEKLVDLPRCLPSREDLILDQDGHPHPLQRVNSLQLRAWLVSCTESEKKAFRQRLRSTSVSDGEKVLDEPMKITGETGTAGVIRGKLIPFLPLRHS
jgi:hypothetical protein